MVPAFDSQGIGQLSVIARAVHQEGWLFGMAETLRTQQPIERQYEHWIGGKRPASVVLVGFGLGADHLASHYYEFHRIHAPAALILLSTGAHLQDLNNIPCNFLLIHGEMDPRMSDPDFFGRMHDAVFHHQMRYGDLTTGICMPGFGADLGEIGMPRVLVRECLDWSRRAVELGMRKQEPAGGSAVA